MSQLKLMTRRRFWPFFWVSFLTGFNDNLFKQGLVVLIALKSLSLWGLDSDALAALSLVVLTLPLVVLSATAGQWTERRSKSWAVRWVKLAEIGVMALGLVGLWTQDLRILMGTLVLMGAQSAFFGPSKYSTMPELIEAELLVKGNALIEAGTFASILLGTLAGGAIMAFYGVEQGPTLLGAATLGVALLGGVLSMFMPPLAAASPDLTVSLNPITPNLEILRATTQREDVFLGVLGLSWFWFLGGAMFALAPAYAHHMLGGNALGVTYFMALFTAGIGLGALFCGHFSKHGLELGLVPFGSLGMTLFLGDLFLVGMPGLGGGEVALGAFLQTFSGVRISVDLFMVAAFAGVFTVPLYTLVQTHSEREHRARVMAGMNIIGALFILAAAGLVALMIAQKIPLNMVFLAIAMMNIAVAVYIYRLLPVFLWRFLALLVTHLFYRYEVKGRERIPQEGAGVLACNHPSFVDFTFVAIASQRPARFIMHYSYFQKRGWRWLFEQTRVIPIAGRREDPEILEQAFVHIAQALREGELVAIFPEGSVTRDGKLGAFRPGIDRILETTPVPVIPMALKGMWGSMFSFAGKGPLSPPFRLGRTKVTMEIGEAIPPEQIDAQRLAEVIAHMGGWEVPPPAYSSSDAAVEEEE